MRSVTVAVFSVASLCWQWAAAQASSPALPEPRRAEIVAASRGGPVVLAGGAPVAPSAAASAGKTVAERKAETMEAARKGQLVPAGHGSPAQVQ
jgi:hypothetical protein